MTKTLTRITLAATLAAGATMADDAWRSETLNRTPASQELRGYGRVATQLTARTGPGALRVTVMRFQCANSARATTLVGKFLADLTLGDGVTATTLGNVPATVTPNGVFAGCVSGPEARIVVADSADALTAFAKACPGDVAGAVATADYPAYLDRFDRYGWGCYGMGGFNSFHDWMRRSGDPNTPKDPTEDVQFMIDNGFRFEPWLDPAGFDTSDGIQQNTEHEWMIRMLTEAKMPFSFRVYGNAGGADWTARRFPEYAEQPAAFLMSGWHGPDLHWRTQPHLTWFDKDIHRYMAVKTMDLMRPDAEHPLNMGWMHPHGELAHDEWYDVHDDYSNAAHRNWQAYLRGQGLTLADVSRLYGQPDQPFGAWEQVPVPEFAMFAGLPGQVQSLASTWFWRREREGAKKEDTHFPGLTEAWHKQPLDTATWQAVDLPDDDAIFSVLPKSLGPYSTTWFRHTFTLTPAQLPRTPPNPEPRTLPPEHRIYLYWFPISHGGIHSGEFRRFHSVFVNGEKAGEVGTWGALDVTKLLRAGDNEIAVQLFGPVWNGRMFLSTDEPKVYPYLGTDGNRLFLLWQTWHLDTKYAAWQEILDGMRQVDPNRPIKFMAPIKFGADRWLRLARDWGGFAHFTGEGMWFFPWYKRYGFLYDQPGSSETAGPANNLADQYNSFRRTFLAGLNAHDPVFLAQTYTRNPELRQWWLDHNPVLKRMGKYDIDSDTPQVLLYRSTKTTGLIAPKPYPELGQATREIQNAWDWDLGRGTLQTLGQSYLYLDDGGLSDGKMVGFNLMIDSGNETMPDASVDAIAEWVKAGGTFVTLPFTGRNSTLAPDTWPITRLTGCRVAKQRQPGQGTITIGKDQTVLTGLAGKTFPDAGRSMDWIGNNHNLLSTELEPGPDCDVVATFENGAPAIVRRKLGAGTVIALGTAFWRQSEDRMGVWWPEPLEAEFLTDLLRGVGLPAAVCTSDDRLVWPQPYRSNNGLDAVTCLVSWHDDKDVTVTLTLRTPQKPARLTSYGVDGTQGLPFEWVPLPDGGRAAPRAGGIVTTHVPMPAKEVKVIAATVYEPSSAVEHWWQYQQKMWHELRKPTIDFAPYREGKWRDPTLDLRKGGAELTLTDPAVGQAQWTPCPVSILNLYGAKPNQPVWLRKSFRVPEEWAAQGGTVYLISGAWAGPHYQGSARLTLNGVVLHDFPGTNYQDFDATRVLHEGENELVLAFKGDKPYQGMIGSLYLYHVRPPARKLELAGTWDAEDAGSNRVTVQFPGEAKTWVPTREILIPKEWEGEYDIRLHTEGGSRDTAGAMVNGRLVRRHHHWLGTRCDIDITHFIRFGAANRIELVHVDGTDKRDPARPPAWNLTRVELDLYEPGK